VDLAVHIRYRVVDHLMGKLFIQSAIPNHGIGKERRSDVDVLFDDGMHGLLLPVGKDHGPYFSTAFQDPKSHCLITTAGLGDSLRPDMLVHVAPYVQPSPFDKFRAGSAGLSLEMGLTHTLFSPYLDRAKSYGL
jgi:hypothetical protein